MSEKICLVCGKEYTTSASLERHKNKKTPCKKPEKLIQQSVGTILKTAGLEYLDVPTTEFRSISSSFHSSMTHDERTKDGIFFTPKKVRDLVFSTLERFNIEPQTILEPSFGSGEFLLDSRRIFPNASLIVGVEKNEKLYSSVPSNGILKVHKDFLEYKNERRFDLIVGNPPYFVIDTTHMTQSEKATFQKSNAVCMTGRPNIFISFLYKCLHEHLTDNGYLAFIIPTSIYNCSYYQPMRNYISQNTTILHLETLNKPGFYETAQDTCFILLQKRKGSEKYIFRPPSGTIYITPYYKELTELCKGTTTLKNLGLDSKTGNVVWNQVKENLSEKEGKLLIYASNIANSTLQLNNLKGTEKKQYVKNLTKPTISGPVILVDRGYGNTFKFNAILLHDKEFYAENHINVIYAKDKKDEIHLERVIQSLNNPRTLTFVKMFVGNGMMSSSELEAVLPIF